MMWERVLPWALRVTWIVVLVAGMPTLDAALDGRSHTASVVAQVAGGLLWLGGVAAMAIPAVVSLTATRLIVPLSVPAAMAAWSMGAGALESIATLTACVVATLLALSSELGRTFVQASAYGDEDRHLLRAPMAYLMACVLCWWLAAAAAIIGVLLLAASNWIVGSVVSVVAIAISVWGWARWHKLARRWVVLVPTGVVLHDHLVLGETLMIRTVDLAGIHLALAGTEAADLTGPATGHAVEIVAHEPVTVIMAATPKTPRGTVIHMRAGLIAPTRPGRLLAAAAHRKLPVG